jgi:fructokinase
VRIGVDLGGTKIEAVAMLEDGRELVRRRVATPRGDYGATLDAIASLVLELEQTFSTGATVGVGIPGTLSPATGLVKNANSTWLIGRPLADDLPRLLKRPVRFANDANCFALSEATDGAATGAAVVFGVILGTGVGGGIVIDGHVVVGANAIAGEWGHNPLPGAHEEELPGPPCYCGRRGCTETFLSGPALMGDYDGTTAPDEIVRLAAGGDGRADETLRRYENRLARALASVINVLDPDVIVLGGGLSNIERLYASVPRLWIPHAFSDRLVTKLVRARHGDSSGVRGAAWLWNADEGR